MGVNKVIYDGNTLIDITDTTAAANDVISGKYFYAQDGTKTLGNGWIVETQEYTPSSNITVSNKSWTASSMSQIYYMIISAVDTVSNSTSTPILQNTFTGDIIDTKYTIYMRSSSYSVSVGAVYTIDGNTASRSGSVTTSFQAGTTYRIVFIGK